MIGASTGSFGAVWAQAELCKVLAHTGARVIDLSVARADDAFDDAGVLLSDELDAGCADVLAVLVAEARSHAELLAA